MYRSLLAEYQLIRRSLEPVLFILTSVTTLLLVLDLFYCTNFSLEHALRPVVFLQQLIINTCLLLHLSLAAEDCYADFRSTIAIIRYGNRFCKNERNTS